MRKSKNLKYQHAFRPTGSTTAALADLFFKTTEALQDSNHVRCFLIDFSKAFDTVPHYEFLSKIKAYGCPQILVNWIADYLTGRTQSVPSATGLSSPLSITCSLVQGSGFGPAGFVAYIADLQPRNDSATYFKFAGDLTVLLYRDDAAFDEVTHIKQWADKNKLRINISKTKEIVFRTVRAKGLAKPQVVYDIEQVEDVKLLGVHFNSRLSFKLHIDYVASVVAQRFYLLNQLRSQGLDLQSQRIVFNALVMSKIMYACQSYHGHMTENELSKLQSLLNRAYRLRLTEQKLSIKDDFDEADRRLFMRIVNNDQHCLNRFLQHKPRVCRQLRKRGHTFALPVLKTEQHRVSFIPRCLLKFI